ncbi:pyridoxal phosphate-dependent aminotransferase [Kineosporia mesophila]|uniref:Aminotransferase n=1 Tax=Kineosporia mesophila TaxID=566012 RepID=A0ABP6Z317_9ACTN|nr:aminotransferase class I/II-fold pyridoxal phosphate-dependent enzyme [Kineosporia mesophila]MCD5352560.1 aminotransferase class I/II-fold pyridoxal phosphate-dependent enzyme [Kineosporia mesophila]
MPQISPVVQTVPASGIRRIFELAAGMDDVVQLSVGEPELPVARPILEAGAQAWQQDLTRYTPNSGISALRSALASKLLRDNGYRVDADQVHVTAGGAQALHTALTFTLSPGDEVLVPDPGYTTFTMASRLIGAVPVPYPLDAAQGFAPDLAVLESLITPRTRVLLVNSPSNPLGVVFSRRTAQMLLDLAVRHDLWVISDEVYEYLTFDTPFISLSSLENAGDRVFGVYSLSKTYALTGARVGYLVTPPGLSERFRAVQESIVSCVNTPAQYAALAAVTGDQQDVARAREHYRANLEVACSVLEARGLRYQRPAGAFYLWIDVSHVSEGDVSTWAEKFLLSERVAVAPGSAFGTQGEGWVRICFAGDTEPLATGLGRFPAPA